MPEKKNTPANSAVSRPSTNEPGGTAADSAKAALAASAAPDEQASPALLGTEFIPMKIMVLSGKGGVGKSTVAANLAVALAQAGKQVGLLDVDFHGPSIPKLLGLEDAVVQPAGEGMQAVPYDEGLNVMSLGILLRGRDEAVIWRGPLKAKVIGELLEQVAWGPLDVLVIDFPPGTGDEPLSVAQLINDITGAVVVTTPQDLSVADVRRCIRFCRNLHVPVLGVIENMSGFVCPKCGEAVAIFKSGGGRTMAEEMDVPFLGAIPIDPKLVETSDAGRPIVVSDPDGDTARIFRDVARAILERDETTSREPIASEKEDHPMRIAIPLAEGRLAMHFGHCQEFAFVEVDPEEKRITAQSTEAAPAHEPGLLPKWLAEHGVSMIVAGGMGRRAQDLFAQQDIQVLTGAPALDPESIVGQYLDGTLATGDNLCDH